MSAQLQSAAGPLPPSALAGEGEPTFPRSSPGLEGSQRLTGPALLSPCPLISPPQAPALPKCGPHVPLCSCFGETQTAASSLSPGLGTQGPKLWSRYTKCPRNFEISQLVNNFHLREERITLRITFTKSQMRKKSFNTLSQSAGAPYSPETMSNNSKETFVTP